MGKDKKEKRRKGGLAEDIIDSNSVKASRRVKHRARQGDEDEQFVADKLSKKILDQAREQQHELELEFGVGSNSSSKKKTSFKEGRTKLGPADLDKLENEDSDDDTDNMSVASEQYYEDIHVDEEDEKALEMFMNKEPPQRRTLADIIMDKIHDKKTEIETQASEFSYAPEMDERLVKVFKSVGEVLSKYRSGKLPKAFKIIPSLTNWEEVLFLTNPDGWSAAAMFQATRIFVSNLNAKMAQRFFNLVLYPRVRDDIAEYKKLNYHLYMSLKKALFKPAAFFKGILIPLAESGNCTLREAVIMSSVLAKTSIPVLHSSAALLKIAEMEYSGANSIFIRTLLDKKYALPFRVIDSLVFHFLKFMSEKRVLPVLWHQSLLTFVERYKEDISSEQKDALLELCRAQTHAQITDEVRRELLHSQSRDVELDVPMEAV